MVFRYRLVGQLLVWTPIVVALSVVAESVWAAMLFPAALCDSVLGVIVGGCALFVAVVWLPLGVDVGERAIHLRHAAFVGRNLDLERCRVLLTRPGGVRVVTFVDEGWLGRSVVFVGLLDGGDAFLRELSERNVLTREAARNRNRP